MSRAMFLAVGAALIVACVAIPYDTESNEMLVNDQREIDKINTNIKSWVAGHNEYFHGWTLGETRKLLGTILDDKHALQIKDFSAVNIDIPASFDSRTQWPGLIHPIRNQAHCGSCWAFAASEALSDRFAIATNKSSPVLSAQDLVACDKSDMGCNGGRLASAWAYLKNTGIVTDGCDPYTAAKGVSGKCLTKCADNETFTKYKSKDAYHVVGVENIQKEIMSVGPVEVSFTVYGDFMKYKSGVYHKAWWELFPKGGHAVKMIGWGVEDGRDYWLIANSWDTTWGEKGFFKIRRGHNECGIEAGVYGGHPAV